jgi:hypothetical protein
MDHFHNGSQRQMGRAQLARRLRRQEQQGGTQPFASQMAPIAHQLVNEWEIAPHVVSKDAFHFCHFRRDRLV